MNFFKKYFSPLILLFALVPFFLLHFRSNNFFITHDGLYHIERTFNLISSLKEGVFTPGWIRFYNNDFGSPVFLYLFPVPYIFSAIIALTGINLVSVLKFDFLFWDAVAAGGMYLWLRRGLSFSRGASLVGAIFYLYSPINLAQVFVRGSLREFAGAAVFPLVLLSMKQLNSFKRLSAIGIHGLLLGIFLLTDGITVVMFLPIIVAYTIFIFATENNRQKLLVSFLCSSAIAFLISSYIYLPFIFEMKFLHGPTSYYLEHFVYWWQLFDYHWGYGFSLPGPNDSMSFQLGMINLFALIATVFFWFKKKISFSLLERIFFTSLAVYLLLIVEGPIGHYLWKIISPLQLIQLPWRLLVPSVFLLSFFAASLTNKLRIPTKVIPLIFLAVLAISFRYLRTNQIFEFDSHYLVKNAGDATAYHEFIPVWRSSTSDFSDFPQKVEVVSGQTQVSNVSETNNEVTFESRSASQSVLRLNTLYYPGWKVTIDKRSSPVNITSNVTRPLLEKRDLSGLMTVSVPQGKHTVSFRFGDTPIRKAGKLLSVLGLTLVLLTVSSLIIPKLRVKGLT